MVEPAQITEREALELANKVERNLVQPLQEMIQLARHMRQQVGVIDNKNSRIKTLSDEIAKLETSTVEMSKARDALQKSLRELQQEHAVREAAVKRCREEQEKSDARLQGTLKRIDNEWNAHTRKMDRDREAAEHKQQEERLKHERYVSELRVQEEALRDSVKNFSVQKDKLTKEIALLQEHARQSIRELQDVIGAP